MMNKLEFSHREAFHRHLANIYNIKERHSLAAKNKYFDKCKEVQEYAFSREEKELRRQLAELLREKNQLEIEGSCLDDETRDAIEKEMQDESDDKLTAHDVAVRMLRNESPRPEKRNKRQGHQNGERVRHTQQSSWHGRVHHTQEDDNPAFKLPDINKRGRSRSIADPKQIAQQNTRHLAWTTEKGKHNKAKPKNDGRSAHTNMTKKSLVKLSTPNIVVIAPGDSTSSMPSETVIKVEDIAPYAPPTSTSQYWMLKQPSKSHQGSISAHGSSDHMQGHRKTIDQDSLQHYYDLLAENERLLKEENRDFETPADTHCPLGTLKRSNKRKLLALEALLMQLPSFKAKGPDMDPVSCLNCRYLRLSKQNISDLEDECYATGIDPGVHAHMDEHRVLEYYDKTAKNSRLSLGPVA